MSYKVSTLLTFLGLGVACGGTSPQIRFPTGPLLSAAPSLSSSSASYAYVEHTGQVNFLSEDDPSKGYDFVVTKKIQVLTPAGRGVGTVQIFLSPWEELRFIEGRSYRPGHPETVAVVPENSVAYRAHFPKAGILYRNARWLSFEIPGVDVGDIVEYRYGVRSQEGFTLPSWAFDRPVSVKASRFVVEIPSTWTLGWRFRARGRFEPLDPNTTEEGGRKRYVWSQNNLPPIPDEPYLPGAALVLQRLRVWVTNAPEGRGRGFFSEWADVGTWYRTLSAGLDVISSRVKSELTAELKDRAADPEALFDLVRDRIRYLQLYESRLAGFRPHDSARVFDKRYGDCKDMANLLVGLYRAQGLEAYPGLVHVGGLDVMDEARPAVSAFNHAIVALKRPDGTYRFLDPTDKKSTFDVLPYHLEGRAVLVIRPDDVDLVRVPVSPSSRHAIAVEWDFAKSGTVRMQVELRGFPAAPWKTIKRKATDKVMSRAFAKVLPNAQLKSFRVTRGREQIGIEAELESTEVFIEAKPWRMLALQPFVVNTFLPRLQAERTYPFALTQPTRLSRVIRVERGEAEVVLTKTTPRTEKGPGFEYRVWQQAEGAWLEWNQELVIEAGLKPPEAAKAFVGLRKMLEEDSRTTVQMARGQ